MTGLGFGIGLGLVLSMLIWIGFEELRKKGLLSKEAPNILSAIAAGFSALTTLGLVFIGFQQWKVQEHTDAVQSECRARICSRPPSKPKGLLR